MKKAERYFPFLIVAVFALILLAVVHQQNGVTPSFPNDPAIISAGSSSGKININTASAETLCVLPGIGDSIAARIIQYRIENGRFTSIAQIQEISGISTAIFLEIRDYITIGG